MTSDITTTNSADLPLVEEENDEEIEDLPGDVTAETKAPCDLLPYFMTLRDIPPAPLNPAEIFPVARPLEVEIGSGRGLFLVNAGLNCPEINFLGVEYDYKEGRRAARRFQKRKFDNVRLLGADARIVMRDYLTTGSAQAVHVYFPDPWWKRRHKKRRIYSEEFLVEAARIIKPQGLLHAWTDVEEYFHVMLELTAKNPEFVPLAAPEERTATHDMDYHTSFERKKRKLGLPIYRAKWQRR